MVGTAIGQACDTVQGEMVGNKNMIQRPAQKKIVCMKRTEKPSPNSGVKQAANPAEEPRSVRSGHIVQVARHNHRSLLLPDFPAHQQQFGIAFGGADVFDGAVVWLIPVFSAGYLHPVQKGIEIDEPRLIA